MNGSLIAINITKEDVKLAEITQTNGEKTITKLCHLKNDKENIKDRANATEILRNFIREESIPSPQTVLVISSEELNYRDFSFPFDSPKKVTQAIGFEISSEFPPNDYIIDHIKSAAKEQGENAFLASMAKKDGLAKRIKEAENAGLQIVGITSDISTLGNYFREEGETLVMDIGKSLTLFALYHHGVPLLVREIPMGIKEIVRGKNLRPIFGEIKRTIHSFNAKTGLSPSRVYVSGNILLYPQVLKTLKEALELDFIDRIPPETGFSLEEQRDDLNIYASVLGAAKWKRNEQSFNFLKDEFAREDTGASGRRYMRWAAIIFLFLLSTLFLSSWLNILALEKRKEFLNDHIRETFLATFPETTRIVDEVRQAKNLLDAKRLELGPGHSLSQTSILDALEIISRSIPKETHFEIMSLFWEKDKLEINGKTDSFKTVNVIQGFLSRSQNFSQVNISDAKSRKNNQNVEFKITVRLAG